MNAKWIAGMNPLSAPLREGKEKLKWNCDPRILIHEVSRGSTGIAVTTRISLLITLTIHRSCADCVSFFSPLRFCTPHNVAKEILLLEQICLIRSCLSDTFDGLAN